ncbi:unnamed protein product [Choristocarpus tenellus]
MAEPHACIATVLHPVDPDSVDGKCSVHERLICIPSKDGKGGGTTLLTLENIGDLRRDPDCCGYNNLLLSLDEGVRELAELRKAGCDVVLDCTTVDDGRDPESLTEMATRTGLHVLMGASLAQVHSTAVPNTPESIKKIGKGLQNQLILGVEIATPTLSATFGSSPGTRRVQAGFIAATISGGVDSADTSEEKSTMTSSAGLQANEVVMLGGSAWAQRATGAPIVISLPPFKHLLAQQALDCVTLAGALPSKVVLAGIHGGYSQPLGDHVVLLKAGATLCFDCFGRTEWFSGPNYFPSDEETAVRVVELARLGYGSQLLVSQGVSRRTHLTRYGGFGYGHALRTVPSRLERLGMSGENITAVLRGNALRLFAWYYPPPPSAIPKNYMPCSWCNKPFEPVEGEYFHKFDFVYCGIRCLRQHRNGGFKYIIDEEEP